MAETLGQAYSLYASTSSPTTATDTGDYSAVAGVTNVTISGSRELIDIANFDSDYDRSAKVGARTRTISGTVHFDPTVDTGQDAIRAAFDSATGVLYVLLTTGTSGSDEYYGAIVVDSDTLNISMDELITVEFSGRWTSYTNAATA